ncbi:integral membrane protein [Paramagnetospirillum caucaseum]|uniref:Integral membrane protein n=1 Tax=Paramagnetospirillum caucaseum TaxID=1244869 RepID=M2Z5M3_9PROT|nr:integral membrane protein [Paramagnetospirillum caucaseum]EME69595.1 integral membrane protein [Paramagnetospirillum caucaseum]
MSDFAAMLSDHAYAIAMALHTLAAVVWVGGMFFAHLILRPVLAERAAAERLAVWRGVFPRFFFWVWISIAVLLATGYSTLLLGFKAGFTGGPGHVDIMQLIGLVMIALYFQLFFGPWQGFKRAFADGDFPKAAGYQVRIRHIVTVNLILGLLSIVVGVAGSLLGA